MERTSVDQILLENYKQFAAFVARRIGNPAAAEDLVQQAFVKALQDPPEKLQRESVLSWFYTILRNSIIDHYRAKAREQSRREEVEVDALADETEIKDAVCQCLHGMLPAMNAGYADLIRRIDLEAQDPALVAEDLHISRNNLDVRLHRARTSLRKNLESMCGACAEHGCLDCSCKKKPELYSLRPPKVK